MGRDGFLKNRDGQRCREEDASEKREPQSTPAINHERIGRRSTTDIAAGVARMGRASPDSDGG
jgi:hypothetical protein